MPSALRPGWFCPGAGEGGTGSARGWSAHGESEERHGGYSRLSLRTLGREQVLRIRVGLPQELTFKTSLADRELAVRTAGFWLARTGWPDSSRETLF